MKRAAIVAIALFALTALSRLPFAAQTLWAHDSALYAAALERGFHVDDDLLRQRPHPPGHILYVASAALARAAGLGTNDALVAVSILASGLGAAALFLLARRLVRERVALIVAAAYAANPLVWQYSEVAYPYTVLGLASVLTATAFWHARGRGLAAAVAASAAFALLGGARQDLVLLLGPLWLWMVWPLGRRRAVAAAAASVGAGLLWAVPTAMLSGGAADYLAALASQTSFVRDAYSIGSHGLAALVANTATIAFALGWGLLAAAPFALAAAVVVIVRAARHGRLDPDATFLAIWITPALGLYAALHIGEWGYVLSVLPALHVLAGRALQGLLATGGAGRRRMAVAWSSLVIAPAVIFLVAPAPFSAYTIATHDRELLARVDFVRRTYSPRSTLILTREDYLLVRYYLPEYRTRQHDPDPFSRRGHRMRTRTIDTIVVFTPGLVPDRPLDARRVPCGRGVELVKLDVAPGAVLEFRGERYTVSSTHP